MVKGEKRMGTSQKMTYETGYRFHIIIKSLVSKGNMHDSKISQQIMDSLKKFYLMLANVAYDPLTIYN